MMVVTLKEAQLQFESALTLVESVRKDLASLGSLTDPLPRSKSPTYLPD